MASITRVVPEPGPGESPIVVARVPRAARREALALVMTGQANPKDPAVAQFLEFARQHQLDIDDLFGAFLHDRLLASALIVPGAGRTAMLFATPILHPAIGPAVTKVCRAAIAAQDPAKVRLVQSLTDPTQQQDRDALRQAGLAPLADLVYMHRYVPVDLPAPDIAARLPGRGVRAANWDEHSRPVFERAILDSYIDTHDCPGLLGVREIEDIILGHMSTGRFDPRLWTVWQCDDQPMAVLLQAYVPSRDAFELVYLGIAPPFRGRGLGGQLVRYGLHQVAQRGGGRIHLAVDQANEPALRLYRGLEFRPNAHKVAMIVTLL